MTSSCFLCGGHLTRQLAFNPRAMTPVNALSLKDLRKSWSKTLCTLLGVKAEATRNDLKSVPFCFTCQELIAGADFILNTISRLEAKVQRVKDEVNDLFIQSHIKRSSHQNRLIDTDEIPFNTIIESDFESVENSPQDFHNTEEIESEMTISDSEIQNAPVRDPGSKITIRKKSRSRSQRSSAELVGGLKSYQCQECPEVIGWKPFRHHVKDAHAVTQPVMFPCQFCSKGFLTPEEVKGHEQLHEGSNPFSCVLCPATLTSTFHLRKHVTAAHASDTRKFLCDVCALTFKSDYELTRHRKCKHRIGVTKLFCCAQCPYQTVWPATFKYHSVVHGDKNFKCDAESCAARFFSKKSLVRHKVRVHGVGGRFVCGTCGATYFSPSSLHKHQLYHSTLRPHVCELCAATFKTRENLRKHMKVHAENKVSRTFEKLQKPRKSRLAEKTEK